MASAVALFLYPHAITGTLAAKRRSTVKRNMVYLPAYSVLLLLIALFGYMAVADPVTSANVKKAGGNAQLAVPYLFQHLFRDRAGPVHLSTSAWLPFVAEGRRTAT